MKTPSLESEMYFIRFIDDFSRVNCVYFLKEKLEAFSTFKKIISHVEKQKCCIIKTIRNGRGCKYKSQEFKEYCKNEGIQKQLTARYTPQQNGASERRNRTIVEMARTMMNEKMLSKYFWVEKWI